jgi:hypothetical protein
MAEITDAHVTPDKTSAAIAVDGVARATARDDPEWLEFRQWYALMLEEEALFGPGNTVGEPGTYDDNRHAAVTDQMRALRAKLQARLMMSSAQEAALAIIAFYSAEKPIGCEDATGRFRFLKLGTGCRMDDEGVDFEVRVGMKLIEKAIREAVAQHLLPGVKIYGEGGNT